MTRISTPSALLGGFVLACLLGGLPCDALASWGCASVTLLARSDRFIPVDTEAVRPEDRALARDWGVHMPDWRSALAACLAGPA